MGAFKGAADIVFGFGQQAQAIRANDLAAQEAIIGLKLKNQELDFNQAVMPLKLQLLQQQVASENLAKLTQGFTLYKAIEAEDRNQKIRALIASQVADFGAEFERYSAAKLTGQPVEPVPATVTATNDLPSPAAPAPSGLGLPMPSNEPGASASATPQLLPPIDPETGGMPQATTTTPSPEPSLAEAEFAAFRKSGAGFFSPSSPPPPEPMEPPSQAPSPSPASDASSTAPAVATKPKAVQLWDKLQVLHQFMSDDREAAQHMGDLLPKMLSWGMKLASDPEIAAWQKQQKQAADAEVARVKTAGLIIGHGLTEQDFPDVFSALKAGIPVDEKALENRVKETAEARKRTDAGVYFGLPDAIRKRTEELSTAWFASPEYRNFTQAQGFAQSVKVLASKQAELQKAGKEPTAANDLALIFNYMKVLDPGSAVREGEFATAQNAAGVPEQVRNLFNKAMEGTRLSQDQRQKFAETADNSLSGLKSVSESRANAIMGQVAGFAPPALQPLLISQIFGSASPQAAAAAIAGQPSIPSGPVVQSFATPEEAKQAAAAGLLKGATHIRIGSEIIPITQ